MYSEKTFENYIFWTKVKRVFLIIALSILGAAIGILISMIYETATQTNALRPVIIAVSTIIMFAISILLTMGTAREVQDGYWKMAVLRKLTTIQKLLETNNELMAKNSNKVVNSNTVIKKDKLSQKNKKKENKKEENIQEVVEKESEVENELLDTTEDLEYEE